MKKQVGVLGLSDFEGVIFTPSNEPYLGLEELVALDELIVVAVQELHRAKPFTSSPQLSTLQKAAILLIPSGYSLCLSVRELIRQGYLHGALTLLRPILERAITVQYLRLNPKAHSIWDSGWKYRERPKLHEMIDELFSDDLDETLQQTLADNNWTINRVVTNKGNEMVHGGIEGLLTNVSVTGEGVISNPAKVVDRPDLAKEAALECAAWLAILMTENIAAFPEG